MSIKCAGVDFRLLMYSWIGCVFFSPAASFILCSCLSPYLFISSAFTSESIGCYARDALVYKYLIFRRFIYVCLSVFFFIFGLHLFFLTLLFSSLLVAPARFFPYSSTVVNESNTNNNVTGVITVTGTKIATAAAAVFNNNKKHNANGNGNNSSYLILTVSIALYI